jgi:hypothetical protein
MRSWIARRILRKLAKRYNYDVSYLEMMLNESPVAFFKFAPVMKAAGHREVVPIEASYAARSSAHWPRIAGPAPSWSSIWRWKRAWRKTRSKPCCAVIRAR